MRGGRYRRRSGASAAREFVALVRTRLDNASPPLAGVPWRGAAIIGIATLVLYLGLSVVLDITPQGDAAEHHALAVNLLDGHGLALPGPDGVLTPSARRPPVYPLFVAGIYAIAGADRGWVTVGIVQGLLMGASAALTCIVGATVCGRRTGILAGILFAFSAGNFALYCELLAENLAIPLTLLLALALLHSRTSSHARISAGLLLGLLILTKPNAVLLAPLVGIYVWRATPPNRRLVGLAGSAAVLLVVLAPWWVRNARAFGDFVPFSTTGGWNFYLGHNPDYAAHPAMSDGTDYAIFERLRAEGLTEPEVDRALYRRGLAFLRAHPGVEARNVARKLVVLVQDLRPANLTLAWLILLMLGATVVRRSERRWRALGCLLIAAGLGGWGIQLSKLSFAGIAFSSTGLLLLAGVGLLVQHRRWRAHGLLLGIFLIYCLAGIVYIPLYRIRWTVDWVAVVYAAAFVDALIGAMATRGRVPRG